MAPPPQPVVRPRVGGSGLHRRERAIDVALHLCQAGGVQQPQHPTNRVHRRVCRAATRPQREVAEPTQARMYRHTHAPPTRATQKNKARYNTRR